MQLKITWDSREFTVNQLQGAITAKRRYNWVGENPISIRTVSLLIWSKYFVQIAITLSLTTYFIRREHEIFSIAAK